MELDDRICICYGVSLRKLLNFARREKPRVASQMSECLGAGTGCGWCIRVLEQIVEADADLERLRLSQSATEYAEARAQYRKRSSTQAPPATPETPAGEPPAVD